MQAFALEVQADTLGTRFDAFGRGEAALEMVHLARGVQRRAQAVQSVRHGMLSVESDMRTDNCHKTIPVSIQYKGESVCGR